MLDFLLFLDIIDHKYIIEIRKQAMAFKRSAVRSRLSPRKKNKLRKAFPKLVFYLLYNFRFVQPELHKCQNG